MVTTIGIDPHKATHTAVAINDSETVLGELTIPADGSQTETLLDWAQNLDGDGRVWAVEAAGGLGYLLSQQLVASGEQVVDVPPVLASRVRVLGSGRSQKNDPNDALSVAVAALRQTGLAQVRPEDHAQVLRMLAKRHLELTALRTQAVARLHSVLMLLRPGGMGQRLSADKAARMLGGMRNLDVIGSQRRMMAKTHLADIRRWDREIKTNKKLIAAAVVRADTTVTDVYGVGPVVAAFFLIGYSGDIGRFATAGHYASYNGTAPIEYSSGGKKRHRLSMRGNRKLNHAIHMAAVTQISHDTPGRIYYNKKQAEGKTRKEALRALKRRISDIVYQRLVADQQQTT
ncbi:MAG: IS110 family transposase [Actinomycetota bacterium]|nr:IS110 family transposase [Actinomycetota bacterium]